jgi:hypothetical protein
MPINAEGWALAVLPIEDKVACYMQTASSIRMNSIPEAMRLRKAFIEFERWCLIL